MTTNNSVAENLRLYRKLWIIGSVVFVLDQLTKFIITLKVPEGTYHPGQGPMDPIAVISDFFYIVHILNPGAAWGMLSGYGYLLTLLGFVALFTIWWFRNDIELHKPLRQVAGGLLCGGIAGNMVDRLLYGHVVDFLDFHLPLYGRWPAFNIADCGIVVGVIMYVLMSFFGEDKVPPQKEASE